MGERLAAVAMRNRRPRSEPALTIGVEEEFLLVDPETGVPLAAAEKVVDAMPVALRSQTRREFRPSQFECATQVATGLSQVRSELGQLRRAAAVAAQAVGARLVAIGAAPVRDPRPAVSDEPRYVAMARQFGALANDPAVCGCHVHVGIDDRELAVQVSNHLRLDLPVLQAMTANSPLHDGADSGYASWRSMVFGRWPSVGPTPFFRSASDYDATVRRLIGTGVMMDEAMVYWYARLSAAYPTIEVRVGDVCQTVGETVMAAGLVRGLVVHAIDEVCGGVLAPAVPDYLVAAAHWRAARDGLDGRLVDVRAGTLVPAWQVVEDMVARSRAGLVRHGDWPTVARQLAVLRRRGTGAARQRRTYGRTGDTGAVLAELIAQTATGD